MKKQRRNLAETIHARNITAARESDEGNCEWRGEGGGEGGDVGGKILPYSLVTNTILILEDTHYSYRQI